MLNLHSRTSLERGQIHSLLPYFTFIPDTPLPEDEVLLTAHGSSEEPPEE